MNNTESRAFTQRLTIDQTASEVQLHRVLYVIKFLRAILLHVLLCLFAIALFVLAGIDGVYPLANAIIHNFRALLIQNQHQSPNGALVFWIVLSIFVPAFFAFLIWMYRSIINARRFALKFQAGLMLILAVCLCFAEWSDLKFGFKNLSSGFAVLAALGTAILVIFWVSVATALWGVSRSPERSSLLATLDPRLAPNLWIYLNKLLDLPRTPLRTKRTAAAYLVAVAGALLLIASVVYLLNLGGTSAKLSLFAIICDRNAMPQCIALSSAWVREVPFWLFLALVGVKVSSLLQSTAKRFGGLSVADVMKNPDEKFVLYLRPFDTDDIILPKPRLPFFSRLFSFRPFPVRMEEELFDVADGYRPLIAVGKPGRPGEARGGLAYRTYLDDSKWQEYVADRIRCAERIVMVVKNTDGLRWEFERVMTEGAGLKTLFLVDPAVREPEDWKGLEKMVLPALQSAGVAPEAFALESRPIGFFFQGGKLVEIVNRNRTATSYRTAFSHFLAEPLN